MELKVKLHEALVKAVTSLEFRFPNKQISNDLNYSKGVVSDYLNGNKIPSKNFIEDFEKFYKIKLDSFYAKDSVNEEKLKYCPPSFITLDNTLFDAPEKLHALAIFIEQNKSQLRKDFVFDMVFKDVEDKAEIALMKKLKEEIDAKTDISLEEIKKKLVSKSES